MIFDCIKLCRPQHAVKNLLVLFPVFFGAKLLDSHTLVQGILGFLSFCLVASMIYVLNDVLDAERDRNHPDKKNRPVASGRISRAGASVLFVLLGIAGFGLCCFAENKLPVLCLTAAYLILNLAYSWSLKNYPVVDIFILSSGFVFRIYAGGAWCRIPVSSWLFLCVLCAALCFAVGKRRNEMLHCKDDFSSRPVLKQYNLSYLTNTYYLFCGATIVFFSLWAITMPGTIMPFIIPLVIFILMRYNLIIETTGTDGDPLPVLLKDKILLSLLLVFLIACFAGIYLFRNV